MALKITWLRQVHSYLGVFFAPLLLLFVLTGWWQTMGYGHDDENEGRLALMMGKLSRVHTDGYYPPQPDNLMGEQIFRFLVVGLCLALALSVFSGLYLAWKMNKKKGPLIAALVLGFLIPVLLLALR